MKRTIAIHIAVISFLLLLPASSAAKDTWTKIRSKNFTVIGNTGERDIRKLAANLEEFRHVISLLFPQAKIEIDIVAVHG